jgi:oligopeptide transport system substrate-binding protein
MKQFLAAGAGALVLLLAGCNKSESKDPITISVVGKDLGLTNPDRGPLSASAKLLNNAVAQGLVAFDAGGQIEPALAERWIVTSDGLSYIFRIREATWSDGRPVASAEVAQSLRARMSPNSRNTLRGMFSNVSAVIPMTGQVVEIRLRSPEPNFLQLLAHPEMATMRAGLGSGPYRIHSKRDGVMRLRPDPEPGKAKEETVDDVALQSTDIRIRSERTAQAAARFVAGGSKYLLGGTFADLPIANAANPSTTDFDLDSAFGLFGLLAMQSDGLVADRDVRFAMSMVIDREALVQRFGVSDWRSAVSVLPLQMDSASPPAVNGTLQEPYRERLLRARALLSGKMIRGAAPVRVAMPEGPGARLLFAKLAADWRAIGIRAVRVGLNEKADLRLIDEVAPFSSAVWYLRRLSCIQGALCSEEADRAGREALGSPDLASRSAAIAKADAALTVSQIYIPLALPLRWSLVSPELTGWKPNAFSNHPLRHLRPIK